MVYFGEYDKKNQNELNCKVKVDTKLNNFIIYVLESTMTQSLETNTCFNPKF